jgi:hypothetical protein
MSDAPNQDATNQMELAEALTPYLGLIGGDTSEIDLLDVLDALACAGLKLTPSFGTNDASIAYLLALQPEDD